MIVAPFVGAWIEIQLSTPLTLPALPVAPFVGAWIEINVQYQPEHYVVVAPFVGAWIEISDTLNPLRGNSSLPSWERGLK